MKRMKNRDPTLTNFAALAVLAFTLFLAPRKTAADISSLKQFTALLRSFPEHQNTPLAATQNLYNLSQPNYHHPAPVPTADCPTAHPYSMCVPNASQPDISTPHPCPPGRICNGSPADLPCPPDHHCVDGQKQPCPAGMVCSGLAPPTPCLTDQYGEARFNLADPAACSCPPGYRDLGLCYPCNDVNALGVTHCNGDQVTQQCPHAPVVSEDNTLRICTKELKVDLTYQAYDPQTQNEEAYIEFDVPHGHYSGETIQTLIRRTKEAIVSSFDGAQHVFNFGVGDANTRDPLDWYAPYVNPAVSINVSIELPENYPTNLHHALSSSHDLNGEELQQIAQGHPVVPATTIDTRYISNMIDMLSSDMVMQSIDEINQEAVKGSAKWLRLQDRRREQASYEIGWDGFIQDGDPEPNDWPEVILRDFMNNIFHVGYIQQAYSLFYLVYSSQPEMFDQTNPKLFDAAYANQFQSESYSSPYTEKWTAAPYLHWNENHDSAAIARAEYPYLEDEVLNSYETPIYPKRYNGTKLPPLPHNSSQMPPERTYDEPPAGAPPPVPVDWTQSKFTEYVTAAAYLHATQKTMQKAMQIVQIVGENDYTDSTFADENEMLEMKSTVDQRIQSAYPVPTADPSIRTIHEEFVQLGLYLRYTPDLYGNPLMSDHEKDIMRKMYQHTYLEFESYTPPAQQQYPQVPMGQFRPYLDYNDAHDMVDAPPKFIPQQHLSILRDIEPLVTKWTADLRNAVEASPHASLAAYLYSIAPPAKNYTMEQIQNISAHIDPFLDQQNDRAVHLGFACFVLHKVITHFPVPNTEPPVFTGSAEIYTPENIKRLARHHHLRYSMYDYKNAIGQGMDHTTIHGYDAVQFLYEIETVIMRLARHINYVPPRHKDVYDYSVTPTAFTGSQLEPDRSARTSDPFPNDTSEEEVKNLIFQDAHVPPPFTGKSFMEFLQLREKFLATYTGHTDGKKATEGPGSYTVLSYAEKRILFTSPIKKFRVIFARSRQEFEDKREKTKYTSAWRIAAADTIFPTAYLDGAAIQNIASHLAAPEVYYPVRFSAPVIEYPQAWATPTKISDALAHIVTKICPENIECVHLIRDSMITNHDLITFKETRHMLYDQANHRFKPCTHGMECHDGYEEPCTPPGYYCERGLAHRCPPGFICPTGDITHAYQPCPVGALPVANGPMDNYTASSPDDCACKAGTYPPSETANVCEPCPTNKICPGTVRWDPDRSIQDCPSVVSRFTTGPNPDTDFFWYCSKYVVAGLDLKTERPDTDGAPVEYSITLSSHPVQFTADEALEIIQTLHDHSPVIAIEETYHQNPTTGIPGNAGRATANHVDRLQFETLFCTRMYDTIDPSRELRDEIEYIYNPNAEYFQKVLAATDGYQLNKCEQLYQPHMNSTDDPADPALTEIFPDHRTYNTMVIRMRVSHLNERQIRAINQWDEATIQGITDTLSNNPTYKYNLHIVDISKHMQRAVYRSCPAGQTCEAVDSYTGESPTEQPKPFITKKTRCPTGAHCAGEINAEHAPCPVGKYCDFFEHDTVPKSCPASVMCIDGQVFQCPLDKRPAYRKYITENIPESLTVADTARAALQHIAERMLQNPLLDPEAELCECTPGTTGLSCTPCPDDSVCADPSEAPKTCETLREELGCENENQNVFVCRKQVAKCIPKPALQTRDDIPTDKRIVVFRAQATGNNRIQPHNLQSLKNTMDSNENIPPVDIYYKTTLIADIGNEDETSTNTTENTTSATNTNTTSRRRRRTLLQSTTDWILLTDDTEDIIENTTITEFYIDINGTGYDANQTFTPELIAEITETTTQELNNVAEVTPETLSSEFFSGGADEYQAPPETTPVTLPQTTTPPPTTPAPSEGGLGVGVIVGISVAVVLVLGIAGGAAAMLYNPSNAGRRFPVSITRGGYEQYFSHYPQQGYTQPYTQQYYNTANMYPRY